MILVLAAGATLIGFIYSLTNSIEIPSNEELNRTNSNEKHVFEEPITVPKRYEFIVSRYDSN